MGFKLSAEAEAFFGTRRARLVRFNGSWFTYQPTGAYREVSDELIRAEIRRACEWSLTSANVSNVLDEIKSATVIDGHTVNIPMWLDELPGMPAASRLIICRNGILEPLTGALYAHNERLFALNALPFDYVQNAPDPQRFLLFMHEIFDGDIEAIAEFQKLMGYLITGDTSLQKVFCVVGPKRSGKGTLGRVLRELLGRDNVESPSFTDLSEPRFGLEGLVGKRLALIPDARMGQRADRIVAAERLLNISGEDSISIGRKHKTAWNGKLDARILILSNELPALPDPSGALASRFVVWHTPISFYGREDHTLMMTLMGELPSILSWALGGLRRLMIEGRIVTPASARELLDDMDNLGSPVRAFCKERCTFAPDASVAKETLWSAYSLWHRQGGIPGAPLSKEMFSRAIKTAFPQLRDYRPRLADGRPGPREWRGMNLDQTSATNYTNYGTAPIQVPGSIDPGFDPCVTH